MPVSGFRDSGNRRLVTGFEQPKVKTEIWSNKVISVKKFSLVLWRIGINAIVYFFDPSIILSRLYETLKLNPLFFILSPPALAIATLARPNS